MLHCVSSGQHITYNTQVPHHRDGKNSPLFDSVMSTGENYVGARMIFADLGVSFCGDPGYSVHGPFRVLVHTISHIIPGSDPSLPPLRMALALYSHADIFAGAARMSAKTQKLGVFSDSELWLPYFPADVSVDKACTALNVEYKRLKSVFKNKQWLKKNQSQNTQS